MTLLTIKDEFRANHDAIAKAVESDNTVLRSHVLLAATLLTIFERVESWVFLGTDDDGRGQRAVDYSEMPGGHVPGA